MKLQHPCQKDEHTSKLSVQCLFEKIGGFVTWWNWNPRLLLRESCGGALLFHNLHFRPHPYDRSNRIDTARRCHCCHILMLIQNFWEIASNHQCIILSPSFCWGDILSGKYSSLNPSFDSYHLIFEAPWSSQVILPSPLAVKMSVPQNCLFSVFFEKILIDGFVTWWNCNPRLSSVFLLHHSKLL